MTDLVPFTYYDCNVTASTSAGEGEASNMTTERTAESSETH